MVAIGAAFFVRSFGYALFIFTKNIYQQGENKIMAMSKCPECNKELSSTVKTCVHCGCEVKACPECNTLVLASADQCDSCGFNFNEAQESKSKKADPKETLNKAFDSWNAKYSFEGKKKISTIFKTLSIIPLFLILIFVFASLFMRLDLVPSSLGLGIMGPELFEMTAIMLMFPYAILRMVMWITMVAFHSPAEKSFYNHCEDKKISIKDMLTGIGSIDYERMASYEKKSFINRVSHALNAEYYVANNKARVASTIFYIISKLLDTLSMPVTFFCLLSMLSAPLESFSGGVTLELFITVLKTYFLPAVIIIVLEIIAMIVYSAVNSSAKKAKLNWVSDNTPKAYAVISSIQKDKDYLNVNLIN